MATNVSKTIDILRSFGLTRAYRVTGRGFEAIAVPSVGFRFLIGTECSKPFPDPDESGLDYVLGRVDDGYYLEPENFDFYNFYGVDLLSIIERIERGCNDVLS